MIDDKGAESDKASVEIEVKAVIETNQQATTQQEMRPTSRQRLRLQQEMRPTSRQRATTTTGDEANMEAENQTTTTGDEANMEAENQTTTTGDEANMEAENQTTRQLLQNNELNANNQSPFAYQISPINQ